MEMMSIFGEEMNGKMIMYGCGIGSWIKMMSDFDEEMSEMMSINEGVVVKNMRMICRGFVVGVIFLGVCLREEMKDIGKDVERGMLGKCSLVIGIGGGLIFFDRR